MSDPRLRELERHYRESPTPRTEAAWLCERVRAGELRLPRLQAAAGLGSEGARLAARDLGVELPRIRAGDLLSPRAPGVLAELATLGIPGLGLRVVAAVGRGLAAHLGLADEPGAAALRRAAELLASEDEGLRTQTRAALPEEIERTADDGSVFPTLVHAAIHRLGVAVQVVVCDGHAVVREVWGHEDDGAPTRAEFLGDELEQAGEVLGFACAAASDPLERDRLAGRTWESFLGAVTDSLREDVAPWALEHDPAGARPVPLPGEADS